MKSERTMSELLNLHKKEKLEVVCKLKKYSGNYIVSDKNYIKISNASSQPLNLEHLISISEKSSTDDKIIPEEEITLIIPSKYKQKKIVHKIKEILYNFIDEYVSIELKDSHTYSGTLTNYDNKYIQLENVKKSNTRNQLSYDEVSDYATEPKNELTDKIISILISQKAIIDITKKISNMNMPDNYGNFIIKKT